jgi:hypothetical protein
MKIAICISGNIRTWYKTFSSFQNFYEPIKDITDIFIHTYDSSDCYRNDQDKDEYPRMKLQFTEDEIKNLFKMIEVKRLVIEKYDEIYKNIRIDYPNYAVNDQCTAIAGQLRKLYLCNELQKEYSQNNGFEYDFIIRTRFDLLYHYEEIEYRRLHPKNMKFYRNDVFYNHKLFGNDLYCLASNKLMQIYCDRYLKLKIFNPGHGAEQIIQELETEIRNTYSWNSDMKISVLRPNQEEIEITYNQMINYIDKLLIEIKKIVKKEFYIPPEEQYYKCELVYNFHRSIS